MKLGLAEGLEEPMPAEESEGVDLSAMAGEKAASKVLAALKAGDAKALDSALRAHYEACAE